MHELKDKTVITTGTSSGIGIRGGLDAAFNNAEVIGDLAPQLKSLSPDSVHLSEWPNPRRLRMARCFSYLSERTS